jgi:hypothetical protein
MISTNQALNQTQPGLPLMLAAFGTMICDYSAGLRSPSHKDARKLMSCLYLSFT